MSLLRKIYNNKAILASVKFYSSIKKDSACCQITNNLQKEFIKHGQPTYETHPHLFDFKKDDQLVLPNFTKKEFDNRRESYVKYLTNYQSYYFKNNSKNLNESDIMVDESNRNFIAIIPSGMTSFLAPDVPHIFKQNSDFLYLTGFKEPNSVLVLSRTSSNRGSFKSALFVRDKDEKKEVWEGAFTGPNEIQRLVGIENGLPLSEFGTYLESLLKENGSNKTTLWKYPTLDIVKADAGPNCYNEEIEVALAEFCDDNYEKLIIMNDTEESEVNANTSRTFVQLCRVVKSNAEIETMRGSCNIASEAFIKTMHASHPLVNEHLLYAKFDYECRIRGAEHLSYIPVVAGGPRANILHYIRNDQLIQNDRLVLMDAGCQYREYSSDITRTWPVNGLFKGAQRDLYQACLNVQQHCLNECRPGQTIHNLYYEMIKSLGKELIQLGILNSKDINTDKIDFESRKKIAKYCTHDVGHYLGLDVHDCPEVSKSMPFSPGTVITVEPGIYVRHDDESVPARYRGIGKQ